MTLSTPSMKTPVYFISHGGPNIIEDINHPAYDRLQQIGHEITTKVCPRAILVISAHWQAEADRVYVNAAEQTNLIYDFAGFPKRYYERRLPHVGDANLARDVIMKLQVAGIDAVGVRRGLDHGVWAPFLVAFDPEKNPLNVPVVQMSLFESEDPDQHYRLGEALQALREEGVLIVASGMSVHNLRDLRFAFGSPQPMPYAVSFDEALRKAVTIDPAQRQSEMSRLLQRGDAREAHPDFDHLLPIHVAAGAAGEDAGHCLWTLAEGSLSWAQYRFGSI